MTWMYRLAWISSLCLVGCDAKPAPLDPKAHAEGLYLAGMAAHLDGKEEEALARFEQMRTLSPDDPRLPAALGEVYLAQRKLPEALAQFEKARGLDPKRSTTWGRLGYIHLLQERHDEAEQALERALELNPKDFNALDDLGSLAVTQNRREVALARFKRATQMAPEKVRPFVYGSAFSALQQAGWKAEARALLEQGLEAKALPPELLVELGDLRVEAGEREEALVAYRAAAREEKRDPTVWELVGELELALGRSDSAVAAYRESLRIKPTAVVHLALAGLCKRAGERACAEAELEKALGLATGADLREVLALSDLLAEMGRTPDALKLLAGVSEEPGMEHQRELQLRRVQVASKGADREQLRLACQALRGADAGPALPAPKACRGVR